ncbi:12952_t:CDS:1, partial [Ambispora leptoticha]
TKEQINFVLAENELLDKGVNGTLNLVLNGIKQFKRGEKHLKLTCDNAAGQNKNNSAIQFCQFLVMMGYYESVELNFMIAGHTKFSPDRNFGMIKKKYRKSTIYSKEQFVEVVNKSSPQGLNKVKCYENGKGFNYYDFKVLEKYFVKLPSLAKYHHFFFSADKPGIVRVKEFVNSPFEEFNLLKDDSRERGKIKDA